VIFEMQFDVSEREIESRFTPGSMDFFIHVLSILLYLLFLRNNINNYLSIIIWEKEFQDCLDLPQIRIMI